MKKLVFAAAGSLAIVLASIGQLMAQSSKSIELVVPYPAGGAGDILARLVAEEIGRGPGLQIVIENRPGAGGMIGTETVARVGWLFDILWEGTL
jgi:tripartite-type tricarboxylate transporter receptor subunit TctC